MPLQATSGAASYDAFGGGAAAVPTFIEDVFSTYLYTGNGSTQTITNGIDLSTKGGLVWQKSRQDVGFNHILFDTVTGVNKNLWSNATNSQSTVTGNSVLSNGFVTGTNDGYTNENNYSFVSWTFRKQPKFFDVVTYTGNGSATNNISHNLQSIPGFILVKRTDSTSNWVVCSRFTDTNYTGGNGAPVIWSLNSEDAAGAGVNPTTRGVTSTTINVTNLSGTSPSFDTSAANVNGASYVMYLFAHNAGGFGLTGTDNVISCGGYTGNGGLNTINLGYEAQWVMIKNADLTGSTSDWGIYDNMRGMFNGTANTPSLNANESTAEANRAVVYASQTGFTINDGSGRVNGSGTSYVYVAIRRGPMKVPTLGTSVFTPVNQTGGGTVTTNFPVDLVIATTPSQSSFRSVNDRLRGSSTTRGVELYTNVTNAEAVGSFGFGFDNNTGYIDGLFTSSFSDLYLNFRRAPGFFDEVCYTGNGSTQTITHNLGVAPELIIGKNRTTAGNNWPVLFNFASTTMNYGFLNLTNSCPNDTYANVGVFSAAPTSTSMFLVNSGSMNTNTDNHVAYLFATCAGVSKVFSYTGNGSSQTINCGFTGGARFVLIKRTDSTGDWYVWDSARGIVSGNDPHLSLNTTAAEVTSDDTIDTDSTGFVVNQVSATNVNVSSATYIGLAIA